MDLVVGNVLDYYETQDDDIVAALAELDPNQLLSEVAEDCGLQARRRRLHLRIELTSLPACKLDRRHFQRIVRNMLRMRSGGRRPERSRCGRECDNDVIAIEVTDSGPVLTQEQLDALFQRPKSNGDRSAVRGLGLYIARAMAEAAGGRARPGSADGRRGLTLVAEFPLEEQPLKARRP